MFIDKAKIYLQAGKGGDGHVSFRHEKYVEFGGPDGGNGGKGGSIYFVAEKGPNTLSAYSHAIKVKAPNGENGGIKLMTGRDGKDVYLSVPLGTVVKDTDDHILADLRKPGDTFLACKGGKGGRGNASFKNSVRRTPRIGENGEPGQTGTFYLELMLICDVGLVGLPSVGKSTILDAVTRAAPKIADYPFTTLEPMLGTVILDPDESFVMADLPGLIKGASNGKGLGFVFLRHIRRCRVLLHVLDMSREEEDAFTSFNTINNELKSYDLGLLEKPMIIALNKMDCYGAKERAEEFKKKLNAAYGDKYPVYEISALDHQGLKELLRACYDKVQEQNEVVLAQEEKDNGEAVYKAKSKEKPFKIVLDQDGSYRVIGDEVIKMYRKINHKTEEGMMQLLKYLTDIGVDAELRRLGAKDGDEVEIDDFTFTYYE